MRFFRDVALCSRQSGSAVNRLLVGFEVLLNVHLSIILEINPYPANVENRVTS